MLIKQSFQYLALSIMISLIPFFAVPFYTHYLTSLDLGNFAMYQSYFLILGIFVGFESYRSFEILFFKNNENYASKIISNIFILSFLCSFIIFLLIYFISLFIQFEVEIYLLSLLPFAAFSNQLYNVTLSYYRNTNNFKMYSFFELVKVFSNYGFIVLVLLLGLSDWKILAYGLLFSNFLVFFMSLMVLKKKYNFGLKFDIDIFKRILKISFPFVPYMVGGVIVTTSDRFLIEIVMSIEMVGILLIGVTMASGIKVIGNATMKAWSPFFYKLMNSKDKKEMKYKVIRYSYVYIILLLILTIIYVLILDILYPYIIDEKFQSSLNVMYWMSFAFYLRGVKQVMILYLMHFEDTKLVAYDMLISIVTNIIFSFILIKYLGLDGAAIGTFISFLTASIVYFYYSQKKFPMPWFEFKKLLNIRNS